MQYNPVSGRMPERKELLRAIEEFERIATEDQEKHIPENDFDIQVVLASGVKLRRWMNTALANSKTVRFVAVVEDGVTREEIDDNTTCDIIITKLVGKQHCQAVGEIFGQLSVYAKEQCGRHVIPGGGRSLYTIDGIGSTQLREPDVTLITGANQNPIENFRNPFELSLSLR